MIFVGFPVYQPLSFLSPSPKITKKTFISGITFSQTAPIWLIQELETFLQVFLLMFSVSEHRFPSLWPWACYGSVLLGFPVDHFSAGHFKRCWITTSTPKSGCFSPMCYFQPYLQFSCKILCGLIVCHQQYTCSMLTSHPSPVQTKGLEILGVWCCAYWWGARSERCVLQSMSSFPWKLLELLCLCSSGVRAKSPPPQQKEAAALTQSVLKTIHECTTLSFNFTSV